MKKILMLLLIVTSLVAFASCRASDVPEGMQLVRGGESLGYYFYAPEEWTVANYGNIASAYASNVDSSSVSYTEVPMPPTTVAEYFTESLKEFPEAPSMVYENQEVTFGNAEQAIMYVYDHTYKEHKFRTMQIFTTFEGRFGIFTFNSPLENKSASDKNVTQYEFYEEKRQAIIDNFVFVSKAEGTETGDKETVKDSDGYILVSDKSIAKFSLYLPEEFKVEFASGMVSAALPDGSSVTMSAAQSTNVSVGDYFKERIKELSAIVGDVTLIEFEDEDGKKQTINGKAEFGNAKSAASQEYTFVYNGTKYHVYQVCSVTTFNGFVFTYTATEENYQKHIETIKKITAKVELK